MCFRAQRWVPESVPVCAPLRFQVSTLIPWLKGGHLPSQPAVLLPLTHGPTGMPSLDISANRDAVKYSRHEQVLRVLWGLVGRPLFRLSPRPYFA